MSDITDELNHYNIRNIRNQINKFQDSNPHYATMENTVGVITDHDTFPYPRYFRGVPNSYKPIVAEREAGWRPRQDSCYKVVKSIPKDPVPYPNHCFETSCSCIFPCYPQYLQKFSDRDALAVQLNNACIVQYR